jgi:Kef-type K+ transport system membrane component KefB
MTTLFIIALSIDLDISTTLILILSFGAISLSTNSIAIQFIKDKELGENVYKNFFAKALPNNIIVILLFTTILAIFNSGSTSALDIIITILTIVGFIVISMMISRYGFPRISQKIKNENGLIALLLVNAIIQSCIADLMGLHFLIGTFLSSLFILEKFLKGTVVKPIQEKVANINNYIFIPILGLTLGLNIDVSILFDYELFVPFAILTVTVIVAQAIFSYLFFKVDYRKIHILGSFSKAELSIILLFISVSYGIIDGDIFTSSIILLAILNLLSWFFLNSIKLEKK